MAEHNLAENLEQRINRRARNACDACRARKVKCVFDEGSESTCRGCQELKVDCTHERPRKRRGPPSRYVEEQRRKQQEREQQQHQQQEQDVFANSPAKLLTQSHVSMTFERISLEQLAPLSIIEQIVDDWFEFVHPVAPILHHDTFLRLLRDIPDAESEAFICLVISVCAATVATLRRRASDYASSVTVDGCYQLIRNSRHNNGSDSVSLIACQIKYNMAVSLGTVHGMDDAVSQLLLAEATSMVGFIIHYHLQELSLYDQESSKRLFWLCFAGQCTQGLHSRPFLMPSSTFANVPNLRPQNLNDRQLCPDVVDEVYWHGHNHSYIPGLNALIDLFMLWFKSQQGDYQDMIHLTQYYDLVLCALDAIPPELRWRGGLSRPPRSNFGTDVQMVNLYITQIHIRSFLLEQMYVTAQNARNNEALHEILTSRQNLVNDMLAIVYQMPEETLEANGHSLISKLRDVGLALLNEHEDQASSLENLDRLLAKLNRLDLRPGAMSDTTSPVTTLTSPGYNA